MPHGVCKQRVKRSDLGVRETSRSSKPARTGAGIAVTMTKDLARSGFPAPYALPAAFAALFTVGTVAAGLHGRFPATGVLIACAVIVAATSATSEILAVVPLGVIGWLTVIGFSRPPYAQLRPTGAVAGQAAAVVAAAALGAGGAGLVFRYLRARFTLEAVEGSRPAPPGRPGGATPPDGLI